MNNPNSLWSNPASATIPTSNNLFTHNTNTTNNPFGNNPTFGNNTSGQNNNLFSNNSTPAFNNPNTTTPNLFSNPGNNTTGNAFAGNNMNTGGSLFTNNNMGGGLHGNNTVMGTNQGMGLNTTNNLFTRPQTSSTLINNSMTSPILSQNTMNNNLMLNTNQIMNQQLLFQNQLDNTKNKLQDCLRRMVSRNLQSIRLDSWNIYKDKPLNKLPLKNQAIIIMSNFNQLKKATQQLKKSTQQIDTKMSNISKQTHKKLALYKKCLLQTVSHKKLIQQVQTELQMMKKQMQQYFKPMYNAYKHKKKISVKQPNEFDIKISYDILNKLQILNQRIDDMIACQTPPSQDQIQNTITVFQQLIQYYQNISCSFKQFEYRCNNLKKQAIQKQKRGNYQIIMSKIKDKVQDNIKKQFKYYDLIKQIDSILIQKQKRQEKKKLQNHNKFDTINNFRKNYF